jgi:signal transduction histidine kinase
MLTTQHPLFIFWGAQHVCMYNDAYSSSLGPEKHPAMLGAPGRDSWWEIWPEIGPQIEQVMSGLGATWHKDQLLPILRNGDVQQVYWTYSYSPIDDPDSPHGVGGVLVICTETTDQVLAAKRLAEERARLAYATHLSGVGFWSCKLPFDVLEWDDRVKDHFFFPPGARIEIDAFYARMHPEDRRSTRKATQRCIEERSPYDIVFRTIDPATGAVKWIRALGAAEYADDGTPTHFDGVAVDVSEQKRDQERLSTLNQRLRQQERMKDEFIATLSHELRNPLAPIQAAAQVIAAPDVSPSQARRARAIIGRQVTHMSLLLDDLLDVARITQGKLQIRKRPVVLLDVVTAAVETVMPLILNKQHHLDVQLPPAPTVLLADPLRLSQILANLLVNACKYSKPGSSIRLVAGVERRTLSLTVKDEGIGIAREAISGIFKMFAQVDNGDADAGDGLGIGLSLVKALVRLHGGTIEARSEGLGRGTELVLRLPMGAVESNPA